MFQMKEPDKTPEDQLNGMETGDLPGKGNPHKKEFRVTIIKMFKELRKTKDARSNKVRSYNWCLTTTKNINNQTEVKNKIHEMKKYTEGINRRINEV